MLQAAATGHVLDRRIGRCMPAAAKEIDPPAGRGTISKAGQASSGASSRRELVIDTSGLRTFQQYAAPVN